MKFLFGIGLNIVGTLFIVLGHYSILWNYNDWNLGKRLSIGLPAWILGTFFIWYGASILLGVGGK